VSFIDVFITHIHDKKYHKRRKPLLKKLIRCVSSALSTSHDDSTLYNIGKQLFDILAGWPEISLEEFDFVVTVQHGLYELAAEVWRATPPTTSDWNDFFRIVVCWMEDESCDVEKLWRSMSTSGRVSPSDAIVKILKYAAQPDHDEQCSDTLVLIGQLHDRQKFDFVVTTQQKTKITKSVTKLLAEQTEIFLDKGFDAFKSTTCCLPRTLLMLMNLYRPVKLFRTPDALLMLWRQGATESQRVFSVSVRNVIPSCLRQKEKKKKTKQRRR